MWRRATRVYADAAASTPLSPRARAELLRLLELYGNPSALHQEALAAKAELERARGRAAASIGAHADEIVFTSGGTEGNNLALAGALRPLLRAQGPLHAATSAIEHPSVLEPLRALRAEGLALTELPVTQQGVLTPEALAEALTPQTALVSVQLVNSEIGTIEPIRELAKAVRHERKRRIAAHEELPLYFHCDASQAPLWLDIKVEQLGVDLLTLDGQKICGPRGVGALYVRRHLPLEAELRGGGQERGLRGGTEPVALCGAFAVALEAAQTHAAAQAARTARVRDFLYTQIAARLPDTNINGAAGDERVANNLSLTIPGLNGDMAVIALSAAGVAASTRSACDSAEEAPSHVLSAIGLSPERAAQTIRLTLLPSATTRDARHIARALADIAQRYRDVVK